MNAGGQQQITATRRLRDDRAADGLQGGAFARWDLQPGHGEEQQQELLGPRHTVDSHGPATPDTEGRRKSDTNEDKAGDLLIDRYRSEFDGNEKDDQCGSRVFHPNQGIEAVGYRKRGGG